MLCLALLAANIACTDPNPLGREALSGTVSVEGAPLEAGAISFDPTEPGGVTSGAPIENGEFEIEEVRGLPPGTYLVRVYAGGEEAEMEAGVPPGAPPPPAKELVPPEWNRNSTHTIEITADGENTFEFVIP